MAQLQQLDSQHTHVIMRHVVCSHCIRQEMETCQHLSAFGAGTISRPARRTPPQQVKQPANLFLSAAWSSRLDLSQAEVPAVGAASRTERAAPVRQALPVEREHGALPDALAQRQRRGRRAQHGAAAALAHDAQRRWAHVRAGHQAAAVVRHHLPQSRSGTWCPKSQTRCCLCPRSQCAAALGARPPSWTPGRSACPPPPGAEDPRVGKGFACAAPLGADPSWPQSQLEANAVVRDYLA